MEQQKQHSVFEDKVDEEVAPSQQQNDSAPEERQPKPNKQAIPVEEKKAVDEQKQPSTRYTKTIQYSKTVTGAQPISTNKVQKPGQA